MWREAIHLIRLGFNQIGKRELREMCESRIEAFWLRGEEKERVTKMNVYALLL